MSTEVKEKIVGVPNLWLGKGGGGIHACPGCQEPIMARIICEAMDELGIGDRGIAVLGIGCSSLIIMGKMNVDYVLTPHGRGPDVATGVKRMHPDAIVFTVQGDGDLLSIGAGAFVAALNRSEKIAIFLANNANFGNTGGQQAPTTLVGQSTTTCVNGRDPAVAGYPMQAAELVSVFRGAAYSARGALNTPAHYQQTKGYVKTAFQKQIDNVGLSFVEFITACPPNWHMTPIQSQTWIEEKMIAEYPLGEFKNVDKID